ncbi:MAG: molybdopterin-dependent oxidoreductase [Planctomycetes bacterium]|nr:molybdopterin-dependent oxidoreductase [Planctomycetota bacterium]
MATVTIDGQQIEIPDELRLNAVQAAARAGIEVPHYCWHPGLSVAGSCRMCLIEAGSRDPQTGEISMIPKLVPGCQTPAKDGSVFVTNSEKVQHARAMVEEDLLLNHPIDCPICDKAGECLLQDYHFQYGQDERRADVRPFTSRRRDVGPTVTLFVDRCINCSRCVRFTREITGTAELMMVGRGSHTEIDVVPGFPLDNNLSGNVVDLCPVGALGDKDFLYKQRVWFMNRHAGVCTGCSTGCSIWTEENQDRVYRIKPRENLEVNKWWICNAGRYGYPHVHSDKRLLAPSRRKGDSTETVDWSSLATELDGRLREAGRLAAVLSPHLTVEEAYLLATYARQLDPEARLALGPVPVIGTDETFPGGFTIAAEKCPNRRGVEAVLEHFTGSVTTLEGLLDELENSTMGSIWVSAGYKSDWIDEPTAARLAKADLLVVQDMFASPLSERAGYVLPGAAFAERDGSYVNRHDRLQSAARAIRPPGGVRVEGGLYWRLLERDGLYDAPAVLQEMAATITQFAAAAGEIPEVGVDLKGNLLADGTTAGEATV